MPTLAELAGKMAAAMPGIEGQSTNGSRTNLWLRHGLGLLLLVVVLAYLPSLGGGFLNWDDPWLLESNPMWHYPSWRTFWQIWSDLTLPTRYALGAEYLPMRDLSHLVEAWVTGIHPLPLRLVNLGLYLGVVIVVYRVMQEQLAAPAAALVATAAFALHPVHVESVAWLAGRKDVLAMLFSALAFRAYVTRGRHFVTITAGWFLLAVLSKSMSVVLPLMLPLFDLWGKRRPSIRAIGASVMAVVVVMPVHVYVGRLVGMAQPHAGGSLVSSVATMGPVWLRYAGLLLWPPACSLVEEVPTLARFDLWSVVGYLGIGIGLLGALRCWYRGQTLWLVVLGLLLLPLLPVSQVIVPLQNRMADRYLWWSVLGVAAMLGSLVVRWPRVGSAVAVLVLVFWTAVTAERATLFGDSALVFADATRKTQKSGVAPYQLAMALEAQGDIDGARSAYEEVWRRTGGQQDAARRATNNLARLEARLGNLERAEWILRRGLDHFPDDAKMRSNLAKVLAPGQSPRDD